MGLNMTRACIHLHVEKENLKSPPLHLPSWTSSGFATIHPEPFLGTRQLLLAILTSGVLTVLDEYCKMARFWTRAEWLEKSLGFG